jgi:hypothetical protein
MGLSLVKCVCVCVCHVSGFFLSSVCALPFIAKGGGTHMGT